MTITRAEALLYLNKWLTEQTSLHVSFGTRDLSMQCSFAGHVSDLNQKLVLHHTGGSSNGYLTCSWGEVDSFDYIELRDAAEGLRAVPGAAEFMRERTNIILALRNGMMVALTDLTIET